MTKVAGFSCMSAVMWLESPAPIWSIRAFMASGNENLNIDKRYKYKEEDQGRSAQWFHFKTQKSYRKIGYPKFG